MPEYKYSRSLLSCPLLSYPYLLLSSTILSSTLRYLILYPILLYTNSFYYVYSALLNSMTVPMSMMIITMMIIITSRWANSTLKHLCTASTFCSITFQCVPFSYEMKTGANAVYLHSQLLGSWVCRGPVGSGLVVLELQERRSSLSHVGYCDFYKQQC